MNTTNLNGFAARFVVLGQRAQILLEALGAPFGLIKEKLFAAFDGVLGQRGMSRWSARVERRNEGV